MAANPLKVYSLEDFRSDRGSTFPYPDKCFESIDNPKLSELKLSSENNRQLLSQPNLLGGINVIRCQTPIPATAIPYYSISNRSKNNKHKVWLPLTD